VEAGDLHDRSPEKDLIHEGVDHGWERGPRFSPP
jgi:hypothetical protein